MTKLLYIRASPRNVESRSTEIADAYIEALHECGAPVEVDILDLWVEDLPPVDDVHAAAKMKVMTGQKPVGDEAAAWSDMLEVAARFTSADRYLLAVPMWNGGIPYRLKHFIDVVHQPGITWGLDPETGFFGLLQNKHATLVLTSGAYAPGAPIGFGPEHHATYLRDWLNQAGVIGIDEIRFQPTLRTPDPAAGLAAAKAAAIETARKHSDDIQLKNAPSVADRGDR